MIKQILGAVIASAISISAVAAEGWTGQGEFGLVLSTGNADNLNVNGKFDFNF